MSRLLLYSTLFLFLIAFETGFLGSLPLLFRLTPVIPIFGIWLYHQIPSRIGAWYLLGWGLWYDLFDLSLWSSQTVIAVTMIGILLYASRRVFSHQSLYGLLGLSVILWLDGTLVEALFRFFSTVELSVVFEGFLFERLIVLLELLLGIGGLFLLHLHVKDRLRNL